LILSQILSRLPNAAFEVSFWDDLVMYCFCDLAGDLVLVSRMFLPCECRFDMAFQAFMGSLDVISTCPISLGTYHPIPCMHFCSEVWKMAWSFWRIEIWIELCNLICQQALDFPCSSWWQTQVTHCLNLGGVDVNMAATNDDTK